jgi:hypothetical protein
MLSLTLPPAVDCHKGFKQSFDFSQFPNLQEVVFGVSRTARGLLWIPMALSTLKRATSPSLSALQLNFVALFTSTDAVKPSIEDMGSDLRRTVDEVARIQHEFEGGVKVTVLGPLKEVF